MPEIHHGLLADLAPAVLYRILALRAEVFVLEQDCPYLDPDGRDLEPDAVQLWAQEGEAVLATLRLLSEPDGDARIGRVVTAPAARGAGLAAQLMEHAHGLVHGRPCVLNAQAHLAGWYGRFGYAQDGEPFDEDDIPHVPMRRPASGDSVGGPAEPRPE